MVSVKVMKDQGVGGGLWQCGYAGGVQDMDMDQDYGYYSKGMVSKGMRREWSQKRMSLNHLCFLESA